MKILFKWAVKTLFHKPYRMILSFLLTVISLLGVCVFSSFQSFEWKTYEKQIYYATKGESNRRKNEKYMDFLWEYGFGTIFSEQTVCVPKEGIENFLNTLQQETSLGYCLMKEDKQIVFSEYDWGENTWRRDDTFSFGAFELSEYIGLAKEPSSQNRLYDEQGRFAPYINFMNAEGGVDLAYSTFFKSVIAFEKMDERSLETFGYQLHGRLPQTVNEVTVPSCLYQSFVSYGYINTMEEPRQIEEISSYDDLIGKELYLSAPQDYDREGNARHGDSFPVKIVGVMEYDYDEEQFLQYLTMNGQTPTNEMLEKGNFGQWLSRCENAPIFSLIVHKDYFDCYSYEKSYVDSVVVLKKCQESETYFNLATRWYVKNMSHRNYTSIEGHISYDTGGYTNKLRQALIQANSIMADFKPFFYLTLVFSVLVDSLLTVLPFLEQKKEIKVLRSLGISNQRLFRSVFVVFVLFLSICYTIGTIVSMVVLPMLSKVFIPSDAYYAFSELIIPPFQVNLFCFITITAVVAFILFVNFIVLWFVQRKQSDLERLSTENKDKRI